MPYYCTLDAYSQHSQGRRGVFLSFSLSSGWPPPFSLNQPCACCTSQHERRLRGAAGSWDRPAVFSKIFQKFACVNRDLPCQNLPLLRKKSPPTPTWNTVDTRDTALTRAPRATTGHTQRARDSRHYAAPMRHSPAHPCALRGLDAPSMRIHVPFQPACPSRRRHHCRCGRSHGRCRNGCCHPL